MLLLNALSWRSCSVRWDAAVIVRGKEGIQRTATDCESYGCLHAQHHKRNNLLRPYFSYKFACEVPEEGNNNLK